LALVVLKMARIAKLLSGVVSVLTVMSSPGWAVEAGEPLPDFAIQTFDGGHASRATLAGKPMLLIFWNTWCPICMEELPKINRLAARLDHSGVGLLAINTGINDSENKARSYWKKYGYGFPAGFDFDFEMITAFRVPGVPTILLVDSKGVVRYKNSLLPEDVEERLKQLALH
jgi:peroxiredoxin